MISCKVKDEHLEELTQKLLLQTLDDIIQGTANEDTIRYYCSVAAYKLIRGEALPPKLNRCLAHALNQIALGQNPADAFLIKKRPGRQKNKEDQLTLALRVWYLINGYDESTEIAICQAAEQMSKSYERVRDVYYTYKDIIDAEYLTVIAM